MIRQAIYIIFKSKILPCFYYYFRIIFIPLFTIHRFKNIFFQWWCMWNLFEKNKPKWKFCYSLILFFIITIKKSEIVYFKQIKRIYTFNYFWSDNREKKVRASRNWKTYISLARAQVVHSKTDAFALPEMSLGKTGKARHKKYECYLENMCMHISLHLPSFILLNHVTKL